MKRAGSSSSEQDDHPKGKKHDDEGGGEPPHRIVKLNDEVKIKFSLHTWHDLNLKQKIQTKKYILNEYKFEGVVIDNQGSVTNSSTIDLYQIRWSSILAREFDDVGKDITKKRQLQTIEKTKVQLTKLVQNFRTLSACRKDDRSTSWVPAIDPSVCSIETGLPVYSMCVKTSHQRSDRLIGMYCEEKHTMYVGELMRHEEYDNWLKDSTCVYVGRPNYDTNNLDKLFDVVLYINTAMTPPVHQNLARTFESITDEESEEKKKKATNEGFDYNDDFI